MYDRAAGWPPRDSLPGAAAAAPLRVSQHGDLVQQEWPKLPFLLQNFRSFYQKHYRVGTRLSVTKELESGVWTPPPTMMSQIWSCHHNTKRLFIRAAAEIPTKRTKKRYPAAAHSPPLSWAASRLQGTARTAPPSQAMQQLCCWWQLRQSYLCTPQLASNSC